MSSVSTSSNVKYFLTQMAVVLQFFELTTIYNSTICCRSSLLAHCKNWRFLWRIGSSACYLTNVIVQDTFTSCFVYVKAFGTETVSRGTQTRKELNNNENRPANTTSTAAKTSSENVASRLCNHFLIIQSHYACKMCSNYSGIKLEPALHR